MLPLLYFAQLVQQMAAAATGACAAILDLSIGSPILAILEANAGIATWVQYLVLLVLARTRLSSSKGIDVDTFVADYGLTRLPATACGGQAVLFRATPSLPAVVPVGAQLSTADYSQTFLVVADATNPAYDTPSAGYLLPIGAQSVSVPVVNATPGLAGNIVAGALALVSTSIAYVDGVTNPAPYQNGLDQESDAALRARFVLYINTRSQATTTAIEYAVASIGQNLTCVVQPNVVRDGTFLVIVDDGTGDPPDAVVAQAQAAVNAVAGASIEGIVQRPTIVPVTVQMFLRLSPGVVTSSAASAAVNAMLAAINSLPTGAQLNYLTLPGVAAASYPGIIGVVPATYFVNGAQTDVVPTSTQILKATNASLIVTGG